MNDGISFWDGFLLMLIWIPLIMCWAFALIDLFRRDDLSGWAKALWIIAIIILPFLGVLIYFIVRPVTAQDVETQEEYAKEVDFEKTATSVDRLAKLTELHEKGVLTDEQFEKKKAKLIRE
ncbi:MAG: SHOCT domain-containing protein [Actinobacteria bacterium]|nr:SHOCT domain-containing protein [Actinomycetota bacterium]